MEDTLAINIREEIASLIAKNDESFFGCGTKF
jgi:hypothetical protein